jgi:lysozyme family protein
MKSIDQALDELIQREGGFTDNPKDSAHQKRRARGDRWDSYCTNMGITQFTLSDWLGRQATIEEVRNLTHETAKEIYETKYWTGPRLHTLPVSQPLQLNVFDAGVMSGPRNAVLWLQQVLNLAGFECSADGVVGPELRRVSAQAEQAMGTLLNNAYCERRIQFYEGLAERNPKNRTFLNGWKNRVQHFVLPVEN